MAYILRDSKVKQIRHFRCQIAEALLVHEDVDHELILNTMQEFMDIGDFIYDEIMFALDLIEETHFDYLVRVCDMAEQGKIQRDQSDYVIDPSFFDEIRANLDDEDSDSSR